MGWTVRVLVDTGAQISVLFVSHQDKCKLKPPQFSISGLGEEVIIPAGICFVNLQLDSHRYGFEMTVIRKRR